MQSRILSLRWAYSRVRLQSTVTASAYFLPKTVSPAYGAAVDFLEGQRLLIQKKLEETQVSIGEADCKIILLVMMQYE
jgi:hypothetical protein